MGPTVEGRSCIREQIKEIDSILAEVEGRLRDELFALNGKGVPEDTGACSDRPKNEDIAWSLREMEGRAKTLFELANEIGSAI